MQAYEIYRIFVCSSFNLIIDSVTMHLSYHSSFQERCGLPIDSFFEDQVAYGE